MSRIFILSILSIFSNKWNVELAFRDKIQSDGYRTRIKYGYFKQATLDKGVFRKENEIWCWENKEYKMRWVYDNIACRYWMEEYDKDDYYQ